MLHNYLDPSSLRKVCARAKLYLGKVEVEVEGEVEGFRRRAAGSGRAGMPRAHEGCLSSREDSFVRLPNLDPTLFRLLGCLGAVQRKCYRFRINFKNSRDFLVRKPFPELPRSGNSKKSGKTWNCQGK